MAKITRAWYNNSEKTQIIISYDNSRQIAIPPIRTDKRFLELKAWLKLGNSIDPYEDPA